MPSVGPRLDRLIALSRAALGWEALWRAGSSLAAIAALFLATAWFDIWRFLPGYWRIAGLAAFAGLGIWTIWRALGGTRLSREAAIRRLDESAAVPGTASALTDRPANASADPATAALWRVHLARMEAALEKARVAIPSPRAVDFDRFGLRACAILLAIVAAIVAGPERWQRLSSLFASAPHSAGATARLDAWIDPPPYTGKPPVLLTGRSDTRPAESRKVSAPVGSILVIRAADLGAFDIRTEGGLAVDPGSGVDAAKTRGQERRYQLKAAARLQLSGEAFEIAAIADLPPTIELLEQPRPNLRGSLTVSYRTGDDYGVVSAEARVSNPEIEGRPIRGRTLVGPPQMSLSLPPAPNGLGEGRATVDISESPWAGARVSFSLHARDEGGNEGSSPAISIYLPQRNFSKPLARALVEQRRNLVLDPDRKSRVSTALDSMMIAPEIFGQSAGVFLGLSTANARLTNAKTDDQLRDVADFLWSMALQVEDGGLSDAEKELRAAERQLRDALQRNAPEDEIRRLTEALRSAMDKFLAEMLQRQPGDRDQAQQAPNPNSRTITRDDLRNMLDQLDQMARSGNMADAQQMLDRLQEMLENLRTARRGSRQNESAREMNRALGDMDRLMRDQQQLRDDTFRDSREPPRSQQGKRAGRSREDGDKSARGSGNERDDSRSLRDRQTELRNRLGDIQRRLGGRGGESQQDLKEAEEAMREADGELGESGDRNKAADAQGRALDALKKGSDRLAQQMQNDGQPSDQADRGEGPAGGEPDGQGPEEADPLGRPTNRDPRYNPRAKYDPLGSSPALRAQRVLEELRRRLGDVSRPQDELEYLERLIRRY